MVKETAKKPRKSTKKEPELPLGSSLAEMLGMEEIATIPYIEPTIVKLSPFDFINEITYGKKNLIVDEETEKQYIPFIINKGLSQYQDCILWTNHMNSRPHIPKNAQNQFLLNIIVKKKRFTTWAKKDDNENLDMVMEYYGYSRSKALSALSILSEDDLSYIRSKLFKGGTSG
jgi:hypothetical protein